MNATTTLWTSLLALLAASLACLPAQAADEGADTSADSCEALNLRPPEARPECLPDSGETAEQAPPTLLGGP